VAFFFASYVNPDGAAGLAVEVLKPQAFVLRTDHLICLGIMSEEFGAIDASSFCFRPSQATLTEAPEKFNASLMHGDHALMVSEISIRNHMSRIRAVLFLKTIHRKRHLTQRLKGEDVVSTLNEIRLQRGVPKFLFCDNGSEFTSQIMDLWAYHNQVRIDFSRPRKPTDNAHVESFNGTLRAECLDVHWRQVIEGWRREYNESRPHRSLGERTPSEFACQIALRGDLPGSQAAGNSP